MTLYYRNYRISRGTLIWWSKWRQGSTWGLTLARRRVTKPSHGAESQNPRTVQSHETLARCRVTKPSHGAESRNPRTVRIHETLARCTVTKPSHGAESRSLRRYIIVNCNQIWLCTMRGLMRMQLLMTLAKECVKMGNAYLLARLQKNYSMDFSKIKLKPQICFRETPIKIVRVMRTTILGLP